MELYNTNKQSVLDFFIQIQSQINLNLKRNIK
jgi:hypothetical protein